MKRSNLYIWLTLSILFVASYNAIGQEIVVHNLPKDMDFSTLEPNLYDKDGEERLYIAVAFARIGDHYIYLTDNQILEFDNDWIDQITLVKNSDLFSAMNYQGTYRVVVYNIKESKSKELFEAYLKD